VASLSEIDADAKRTWYISTINLFEDLSEADIDSWVRRCGTRTFESGQRIIDARSSLPEQVLVVRRGAVRLVLERSNERLETVDILGPGQLFGVSAAFGRTTARLHADALTQVTVCAAEGRSFLLALASGPEMVLNLVRQVGDRVIQLDGRYHPPAEKYAPLRLAEVLARLAQTAGEPVADGRRLPACVSRTTLAHQVGCTRETIARMLASFEAHGAVRRERRAIVVNVERLQQLAAASPAVADAPR